MQRTWIYDTNNNRCSVERWGSEEDARQALASLKNCSDCSRCSRCSRCSELKGATPVRAGQVTRPLPEVPLIVDLHAKVYAAASSPDSLNMCDWHTCVETHCRAGWVVTLAGKAGKTLEEFHDPVLAAMLIYDASCPDYKISPARFFDSNEDALADMKRLARA